MILFDIFNWLSDDLLLYADKMSMANSLELRVPYLDLELLDFALRLPARSKINLFMPKYLLKKVAMRHLPQKIVNRPKKGFGVPLKKMFQWQLLDTASDLLLSPNAITRSYLNKAILEKLINIHKTGLRDYHRALFTLLSFELWARHMLKA
jgi:asparagine synthase (glutamine-hydrolysing)